DRQRTDGDQRGGEQDPPVRAEHLEGREEPHHTEGDHEHARDQAVPVGFGPRGRGGLHGHDRRTSGGSGRTTSPTGIPFRGASVLPSQHGRTTERGDEGGGGGSAGGTTRRPCRATRARARGGRAGAATGWRGSRTPRARCRR